MAGWVRSSLPVAVVLMAALLGWLVMSPAGVAPSADIIEIADEPPLDSPTVFRTIELRFPIDLVPRRPLEDYLEMMDLTVYASLPSRGEWRPYAGTEPFIEAAAERLWQSGLLESLWVDVVEAPYPSGVPARRVVFNFVEHDGDAAAPLGPPRVPDAYATLPMQTSRLYP